MICTDDYQDWLQTMYIMFGTKWSKLFCGPLTSVEGTEQSQQSAVERAFNPLKVIGILILP